FIAGTIKQFVWPGLPEKVVKLFQLDKSGRATHAAHHGSATLVGIATVSSRTGMTLRDAFAAGLGIVARVVEIESIGLVLFPHHDVQGQKSVLFVGLPVG